MDVERIRADFPILESIIYMDNASTSLTPEPVLEAVLEYYGGYRANVGRGVHRLTGIASQKYNEAHRKVGEFICAEEGRIFTKNTTEAINMVASGMIEEVSQDNYKLAVGYTSDLRRGHQISQAVSGLGEGGRLFEGSRYLLI